MSSQKKPQFSKVLEGRKKWNARSNQYQAEKRKLEDKNRYLRSKIEKKENNILFLQKEIEEEKQKKKEVFSQNQELREGLQEELVKKKSLEKKWKESQLEIESLKKKTLPVVAISTERENSSPSNEIFIENQVHIHLNLPVITLFLFFIAKTSFRAVPRILDCFHHRFGINLGSCHFTSVISWALRLSKYRLDQVSACGSRFSILIDSSIRWGQTKITAALRVSSQRLEEQKGALRLQDVEVVGLWIHNESTGEMISGFLQELFKKIGNPFQILSDSGSDLLKGIRILPFFVLRTVDIGHFSANLLKKKYQNDPQFKKFLSFTSSLSSKLRQTIASWIVPNALRTKGRFQGISYLAKWALEAFTFVQGHLSSRSPEEQAILKKNFEGSLSLLSFARMFYHETSILNQIQKLIKNEGLTHATYYSAMILLTQLQEESSVRIGMENYLSGYRDILLKMGLNSLILSTDIIESIFGKLKYIYEQAPVKDFNRLALLLPLLAKEPTVSEIIASQKEIKVKEEKEWEKTFFETTRRSEKKKCFDLVRTSACKSKTSEIIELEVA